MTDRQDLRKEYLEETEASEYPVNLTESHGMIYTERYSAWLEDKVLSQPTLESILELMGKVEEENTVKLIFTMTTSGIGSVYKDGDVSSKEKFTSTSELESLLTQMLNAKEEV